MPLSAFERFNNHWAICRGSTVNWSNWLAFLFEDDKCTYKCTETRFVTSSICIGCNWKWHPVRGTVWNQSERNYFNKCTVKSQHLLENICSALRSPHICQSHQYRLFLLSPLGTRWDGTINLVELSLQLVYIGLPRSAVAGQMVRCLSLSIKSEWHCYAVFWLDLSRAFVFTFVLGNGWDSSILRLPNIVRRWPTETVHIPLLKMRL